MVQVMPGTLPLITALVAEGKCKTSGKLRTTLAARDLERDVANQQRGVPSQGLSTDKRTSLPLYLQLNTTNYCW